MPSILSTLPPTPVLVGNVTTRKGNPLTFQRVMSPEVSNSGTVRHFPCCFVLSVVARWQTERDAADQLSRYSVRPHRVSDHRLNFFGRSTVVCEARQSGFAQAVRYAVLG